MNWGKKWDTVGRPGGGGGGGGGGRALHSLHGCTRSLATSTATKLLERFRPRDQSGFLTPFACNLILRGCSRKLKLNRRGSECEALRGGGGGGSSEPDYAAMAKAAAAFAAKRLADEDAAAKKAEGVSKLLLQSPLFEISLLTQGKGSGNGAKGSGVASQYQRTVVIGVRERGGTGSGTGSGTGHGCESIPRLHWITAQTTRALPLGQHT